MTTRVLAIVVAAVVVLGGGAAAWFLAGPGSTGATTPKPTVSVSVGVGTTGAQASAGVQSQIRNDWQVFFNGKAPVSQKIRLLQHGQQFASVLRSEATSPQARQSSARVTNVAVHGSTATVTYDVLLNGRPALQHRTGTAVKTNGTWKVSDSAFCSLVALGGQPPKACRQVSGSGSPAPTSS